MAVSVLALIGFFVALYLLMWKIGILGEMACTTSGCETVQTSRYSSFLGIPVALYGVFGFASMFIVSILGLQPRWLNNRAPSVILVTLSAVGVVFTAYLTYLEAAVIHAWCQWCVVSAIIITLMLAVSVLGLLSWRETDTAV